LFLDKINLKGFTTGRRIDELSNNVEESLKEMPTIVSGFAAMDEVPKLCRI
jgi:hypothetical protein